MKLPYRAERGKGSSSRVMGPDGEVCWSLNFADEEVRPGCPRRADV